MVVCSNRDDEPGFFTTCSSACGKCLCGAEVRAEEADRVEG